MPLGLRFAGLGPGGQWQRLALARFIYHDAPLIILDEPSASLDPIGERQIFGLLTQLAEDKIILFTTHRYDTIRRADTILVLADGQIAEMGAPDVLERKAGGVLVALLRAGVAITGGWSLSPKPRVFSPLTFQ